LGVRVFGIALRAHPFAAFPSALADSLDFLQLDKLNIVLNNVD
jgi:hypothetical protein